MRTAHEWVEVAEHTAILITTLATLVLTLRRIRRHEHHHHSDDDP